MERKITFGKYKGQKIGDLILTHIGYIMWCLDNVSWFSLDEEEQRIYDYVAIAVMKSRCEWTFLADKLARHIKDKEALKKGYTPFSVDENGFVSCSSDFKSPLLQNKCLKRPDDIVGLLLSMAHSLKKFDRHEPLGDDEEYECYGDFFA